jgi:hypothetical protein
VSVKAPAEIPELPDLLAPRQTKRPVWLRVLCLIGALLFFILGIAGWLIPVITGIPFYVAALVLLGMASDRARGWINSLERKLPNRWRWNLRRGLHKLPSEKIHAAVRLPEEEATARRQDGAER